ncbi:MAG TPA: hypothetical protein VKA08_06870 [Balneolales bacterium]|nr:hypothetical protein [Balneolales bacterium]
MKAFSIYRALSKYNTAKSYAKGKPVQRWARKKAYKASSKAIRSLFK